jgi:hypothetical protein
MSRITPPADSDFDEATTVAEFLERVSEWHKKRKIPVARAKRSVWFRGHKDDFAPEPGIYRDDFAKAADSFSSAATEDEKILNLEREMLGEFRSSGAAHFDPAQFIEVYFIAQHFGMPTRLLDWSSNPLAGLFFASQDARKNPKDDEKDGYVFVMDARKLSAPRRSRRLRLQPWERHGNRVRHQALWRTPEPLHTLERAPLPGDLLRSRCAPWP